MSAAKTAEPIEMPFGLRTRVGLGNHVLNGGPDNPMGRGNFEGEKERPIAKYRDTVRHLCKNGSIDRDAGWVVGLDGPK